MTGRIWPVTGRRGPVMGKSFVGTTFGNQEIATRQTLIRDIRYIIS